MSRAGDAGAACATWTIRLFEDVTLVRSMWRLLRAARDPSPFMRVKLASAHGHGRCALGRRWSRA